MAQMEVYDILKSSWLEGKKDGLTSLQISDKIIEGIKVNKYCGSFDVTHLSKDCNRLSILGLIKKKVNASGITYRLNERCLDND